MNMARKRMFSLSVVDCDKFLDLPLTSQLLYFHLGMRADDDGFVDSPRKIQRAIGCSEDDLKLLILKRFVIAFESGVIVIRHWNLHNTIQKDRYHETIYKAEKSGLTLNDTGAYECECDTNVYGMETHCIQNGSRGLDSGLGLDKKSISSASDTEKTKGFEAVWAIYPRKKDKAAAHKAYDARLRDGWSPDELLSAAQAYAAECRKERRAEKYIKHGSTFFGSSTPFVDYVPKTTNAEDDLQGVI